MSNFIDLKKECYDANMELKRLGLIFHTFGNVSSSDHERGVFAIKPSGVPYEELTQDNMVIVDFDNQIIEGDLKPSSDTKTHSYLYKKWNGIGGISHTHALYSVAWSQSLRDIPVYGTTHADHLSNDIPCTPVMTDEMIKGNYEENTGKQIIEYFNKKNLNYNEIEMVLVGNHGPFCWGKSASQSVFNSTVLEEIAKMAFLTEQINPNAEKLKKTLIEKHYYRKHGKNKYYGQ
jgi:L-ribulose-5-phosphate 4-epimerase